MFSVIIPAWNARKTLRRCVERVLAQTFQEFEIIVVDDGSTDSTVDSLSDLGDPRLKVVRRRTRGGSAAARNDGLATATAEWVAFLDADDVWFEWHLEELDRVRRAHPEAALIGNAVMHSGPGGEFARPGCSSHRIGIISYFEEFATGEGPFSISSAGVHCRAWRSEGGFRPSQYGDDSEFLARIALKYPVAASTRVGAVWVHGTGGITDNARDRWRNVHCAADISPAVALIMERRAHSKVSELPAGLSAYVDRYIHWCLVHSRGIGDLATIRRLKRLYEGPIPFGDRVSLELGRLPLPLFRAVRAGGRLLRRTIAAVR